MGGMVLIYLCLSLHPPSYSLLLFSFQTLQIALDLFQYMSSFSTPGPAGSTGGMMVVPNNIFDKWMERFERKYRQDPNFMMKPAI